MLDFITTSILKKGKNVNTEFAKNLDKLTFFNF